MMLAQFRFVINLFSALKTVKFTGRHTELDYTPFVLSRKMACSETNFVCFDFYLQDLKIMISLWSVPVLVAQLLLAA